jgi:hypothetical protein
MLLKFKMIFHDSTKKKFFQNKAELKNLDDFEVLSSNFPGLRTWAASLTSRASATSMASSTSTLLFQQRSSWLWFWIIPGNKINNTGASLWNGSSRIQFFTKIGTSSVGGWWGQSMLLFWKLVVIPINI